MRKNEKKGSMKRKGEMRKKGLKEGGNRLLCATSRREIAEN